MPRPPILKKIDFKKVFKNGKTYRQWLSVAEEKKHARLMEDRRRSLHLSLEQQAWLASLTRPVHVLVIAEDWCGDVHRHVPVLELLQTHARKLKTRYIMREDHPEIFARHLTNGGEAIPRFVFFNDKFVECGSWGPMPEECRRLIARGKAAGDVGAARKRVGAMYEADPNCEVVLRELLALIETAVCETP